MSEGSSAAGRYGAAGVYLTETAAMNDRHAPRYGSLAVDPDRLGVPIEFTSRPIRQFRRQVDMLAVVAPAQTLSEPLVVVEHDAVVVLSAYHRVGWRHAQPDALLRSGTAARLYDAVSVLPTGFGLAVFDAWRPLELQQELFEAFYKDGTLRAGFVAEPSTDPAQPPPHLTGGAVDLTLTWCGVPLRLGTDFDEFSDAAHPRAFEREPGRVRELRRLLTETMEGVGFVRDDCEWWHFEYGTRRWAALGGTDVLYGPGCRER